VNLESNECGVVFGVKSSIPGIYDRGPSKASARVKSCGSPASGGALP
jgi:hypothetical protein